uniref:Rieske domain-containing protein n=1 Tax=Prevotella sp. GTC17260 TaxID=3236796 RepID=A0AB33JCE0_9BACT
MRCLRFIGLLTTILLLTTACNSQHEYSNYPCYVVIDNSVHQDAVLAQAMTPYSGVFATLTITTHGGAQYFRFVSNQHTSSESIFNAIDSRRSFQLGMNGAIIVGFGNSVDATFYAYDRECPNCFDPDAIPLRSKPLSVGSTGIATCPVCHRKYDLNNGGLVVGGNPGNKLQRYPASSTGPLGVLSVR